MNKKLEFFSSMAVAFIVLILVFLCIRFSGQGKFATHGGTNPSDVKCIYTSVWPDNEYTRLICEPESGTIEYILDGSNAGYYAIFYNNISEEEIQKYIDQLKTLSSSVTKKALAISRFAEKLLPEPGVPKIRPLGFFSFFRSTIIRLLDKAFSP